MCWCTPEIRTPWCGKPGCEVPPQMIKFGKEIEDLLHKCLDPYVPPIIKDTPQSFKIISEALDLRHQVLMIDRVIVELEEAKLVPELTDEKINRLKKLREQIKKGVVP